MSNYNLCIVKDYDSFKQLKNEWNRLVHFNEEIYPFVCFEWFDIWFHAFDMVKHMHIYVLYEGENVCAILPLIKYRYFCSTLQGTILGIAANDHSYSFDIISDKKNTQKYINIFLSRLLEEKFTVIYFEDLFERSEAFHSIKKYLENHNNRLTYGLRFIRESVELDVSSGWNVFMKTLSSKFRKNIRNQRNKIHKAGNIEIVYYSDPKELLLAFDCIEQISSKSWQGKKGSGMFSKNYLRNFYKKFGEFASKSGWLSIWVLYFNRKPISYEYHIKKGRTDYALKAEFDSHYTALSPGAVLDAHIVQVLADSDVKKYDLLGYKDLYKTRWSNKTNNYVRIYIYKNGIAGKLCYFINFPVREIIRRCLSMHKGNNKLSENDCRLK